MPKSPAAKALSRSAPTSPKNRLLHDLSTALPQMKSDVAVGSSTAMIEQPSQAASTASPRKSRNATLTNFLKRLSPKLRQSHGAAQSSSSSKSRDKNWYIVEINQSFDGGGGGSDKEDDSKKAPSSKSTSGLFPSRRPPPPLPADDKDHQLTSQTDQQSNEELLGTQQQQRQPQIRINDTDCSSTKQAGPRLRRTQQPPKTLNILNKIVVHQPPVETDRKRTIKGKMASVESIGSCSLDIDATASESSSTAPDGRASSISQRTLHSVSVEFSNLSTSTQQSKSGRTLRSPTSASNGAGGNDVRYVSELYIPNGGQHGDEGGRPGGRSTSRNADLLQQQQQPQRKPSYIGISCSVSGYTSYSCYGSKSSRDNSPARLAFAPTVDSGDEFQSSGRYEETTVEEQHTNSVSVNVNGGLDVVDCNSSSRTGNGFATPRRSAGYVDRFSSYSDDGLLEPVSVKRFGPTSELIDGNNNGAAGANHGEDDDQDDDDRHLLDAGKSLIEQRIERLYGPAALAQGFRLHRTQQQQNGATSKLTSSKSIVEIRSSTSESILTNSTSTNRRNTPAVFRHLRQTFADQLSMTNVTSCSSSSSPKYIPTPHAIPTTTDTNTHVKPAPQQQLHEGERTDADKIAPISNGNHAVVVAAKEIVPLAIGGHEQIDSNGRMSNAKDAHWFIMTMNGERDKIKVLITRAEGYLVSGSLPEDACGRLRAAIGKANLLLAQKFQQFRGLCEKNLIQGADEPFPTTVSDLAGFWDMVLIQVDDIHKMFAAIERMRDRGWIVDEKDDMTQQSNGTAGNSSISGVKSKKAVSKSTGAASTAATATTVKPIKRSAKADEAAKARTEARKRLLEAKRKGRQQAMVSEIATSQTAEAAATIEIYVPEYKE